MSPEFATQTVTVTPTASGIRSPGGIGVNAAGDVFYTDNQGPWNGTCGLKHLRPGKFMGHPVGFKWYELASDTLGKTPQRPRDNSRMIEQADRIPELEPTAVLFPYNKMGKSASGIVCDTTGGRFGPFANQLFIADQSDSTVMRVFLEKIQGHYQGACFPFLEGFASGNVGLEMDPSGPLFVGGTNRGWGSRGPKAFAIQRVDWTGDRARQRHPRSSSDRRSPAWSRARVDRVGAAECGWPASAPSRGLLYAELFSRPVTSFTRSLLIQGNCSEITAIFLKPLTLPPPLEGARGPGKLFLNSSKVIQDVFSETAHVVDVVDVVGLQK